jgi:hypothetical protein
MRVFINKYDLSKSIIEVYLFTIGASIIYIRKQLYNITKMYGTKIKYIFFILINIIYNLNLLVLRYKSEIMLKIFLFTL